MPKGIEREFRRDILELLREARRQIETRLVPQLEAIVADADLSRIDTARADVLDVSTFIDSIVGPLKLTLNTSNLRRAEQLATRYANATSDFSRRQTLRQLKGALGIDAFPVETQLVSMIKSFVSENTALINSVPGRYLDQIGELVQREVRTGTRAADIARKISERFKVESNRAALIARDQVNKFNGQLTRMRQTNLGITEYIWRTSRDERVRESHLRLEGRKFSWNDPPPPGHPGQDFNCRCTAEPVIPGVEPDDEDPVAVRAEVRAQRRELRDKLKGTKAGRLVARDTISPSERARLRPTRPRGRR